MDKTLSEDSQVLLRRMEPEELQYLRDLQLHPGWRLFLEAVREIYRQEQGKMEQAKTSEEFFRSQTAVLLIKRIWSLPDTLRGSKLNPPGGV